MILCFLVANKCARAHEIQLSTELERARKWFTEKGSHLKTKYMIFGNAKKAKQLEDISINLSAYRIDHVESFKYLGIHFEQQLKWKKT